MLFTPTLYCRYDELQSSIRIWSKLSSWYRYGLDDCAFCAIRIPKFGFPD